MQMKRSKKLTSFILCMVLIVAMALGTTGCNGSTDSNAASGTETGANSQTDSNVSETDANAHTDGNSNEAEADTQADASVLGQGSTAFSLTVVDQEGSEAQFEIYTDKETVGEALLELGLIDGEESEYGLYVKTVNGITANYDTDGTYWAFYINGEYASSGVDSAKITEGESYSFKVE